MRRDRERLLDIQEAIQRIERYAEQGRGAFDRSELVQNWFLRHLQIIGEAARALSSDLRDGHPEVPWSKILGMRNILVHDYFAIDKDIVWSVVEQDLPGLKRQIEAILLQTSRTATSSLGIRSSGSHCRQLYLCYWALRTYLVLHERAPEAVSLWGGSRLAITQLRLSL